MTKKINWPIFTDENATLLIKNRIHWLTYYNMYYSISFIIILFLLFWIIIWYISNNYYIAHLNEQYIYYNIEKKYIFNYTYKLFPSILSYKDFWYNYNFIHLYINILFKAPINLIKDLLKLYIYIDNRPFDNTVFHVFYNLIFLKYPLTYWYQYVGTDYVLYYFNYLNQLRSWQYFPRFWWYWTDWFYTYNKDLPLLKFVSPRDRHILYFIDFMRPYFYFLGFYAYNKYLTNYDFFLFLNLNYNDLFLWGFKSSLYDFGSLNKLLNIGTLKVSNFNPQVTQIKVTNQNYIYSSILYNFDKFSDLFKIHTVSFLPNVSFFFIKQLYLPVYLPVESFQKWVSYKYNGSLNLLPSLINYNVHISTVQDYFKLSILMSLFWKNSYFAQIYSDSIINFSNFVSNFIFPLKVWLNLVFLENIDFSYWTKLLSLEWYQFKQKRFSSFFGLWYMSGLRNFTLYFAAYLWLLYFLFSLWFYYFYKDFWMFKIIWQNPIYLWNILNVNHDIENDYMLSVDYLRNEPLKDYMDIIVNLIPVFYFLLASYLMSKVLNFLEISSGFAAYFYYTFGYIFESTLSLWIFYVVLPAICIFLWSFLKKFLFLIKEIFLNFLLLNYGLMYVLQFLNILKLESKLNFFSSNLRILLLNNNNILWDKFFLDIETKYLGSSSKKALIHYWPSKTNSSFDYTFTNNSMFNNELMLFKRKKINFKNNPINALQFVTITNTTWLVMRTNHFYKYYDYIDVNRLSFNQS